MKLCLLLVEAFFKTLFISFKASYMVEGRVCHVNRMCTEKQIAQNNCKDCLDGSFRIVHFNLGPIKYCFCIEEFNMDPSA